MGVGNQCYALATLPLGKNQYPLYRSLGGPWGQSGWVWKAAHSQGLNPEPSSPLCHSNGCGIPAVNLHHGGI